MLSTGKTGARNNSKITSLHTTGPTMDYMIEIAVENDIQDLVLRKLATRI